MANSTTDTGTNWAVLNPALSQAQTARHFSSVNLTSQTLTTTLSNVSIGTDVQYDSDYYILDPTGVYVTILNAGTYLFRIKMASNFTTYASGTTVKWILLQDTTGTGIPANFTAVPNTQVYTYSQTNGTGYDTTVLSSVITVPAGGYNCFVVQAAVVSGTSTMVVSANSCSVLITYLPGAGLLDITNTAAQDINYNVYCCCHG